MKPSIIRRYKRKHKMLGALLIRNPVLVLGLDLPFIIAGATSLKNAVAMTIEMFCIHVVTMMVGRVIRDRLPLWVRALVNVCVATLMMLLSLQLVLLLFPGITNALGMYLYLMAVNAMTMIMSTRVERKSKIWPVFSGAMLNALGFSIVALGASFFREYFGNGTLWGIAVGTPFKLSGLLMPFAGFILIGIILAATRFLSKWGMALMLKESVRKDAHYTKIHVDSVEPID